MTLKPIKSRASHDARTLGLPAHVFWPGLVIGLLLMSVAAMTTTIFLAVTDPSFAVEPNYTEHARNWDETAGARRASDALGWTADIMFGEQNSPSGERDIRVRLTDETGAQIPDASVVATLYHPARSKDRLTATLTREGTGDFRGVFHPSRAGLWEIELVARQGEAQFLDHQQQWLLDRNPH